MLLCYYDDDELNKQNSIYHKSHLAICYEFLKLQILICWNFLFQKKFDFKRYQYFNTQGKTNLKCLW